MRQLKLQELFEPHLYNEILKAVALSKFESARIFKGFIASEEHGLHLVVEPINKSEAAFPSDLAEALEKLLNISVSVTTENSMRISYLNKIKNGNCVVMHSDIKIFKESALKYFGQDWVFQEILPRNENHDAAMNTFLSSQECLFSSGPSNAMVVEQIAKELIAQLSSYAKNDVIQLSSLLEQVYNSAQNKVKKEQESTLTRSNLI